MARQVLENRVESLEQRVTILEQLPTRMDRLELQIVQLRAEMHDEFCAIRQEIRTGDDRVATLSARIEDARRETRVLHEDAIGRIAVIGEGVAALSEKVDHIETTLSQKVDRFDAALSEKVDRILVRIDGRTAVRKTARRGKKR